MKTIDDLSADALRMGQPTPAADPFREATGRLRTEAVATWTALKRSFYVERQSLGLSMFEGAFRLMTFIGLGATGIALTILAAFLVVGSARRGLTLWTQDAWWSDIVVAVFLGASVVLIAHAVRRYVHRSVLACTRRGLECRTEKTA